MNDELERLKRGYRQIEAPPDLLSGVRIAVTRRPRRPRAWLPAVLGAAAVAGIVFWALPVILPQTPLSQTVGRPIAPPMPTLSTIARLTPARPEMVTPGLSQLRSVPASAMPEKPERIQAEDPQTRIRIPESQLEENHHAQV